jgi:ABC-type multidrug transport system permease subunit
MKDQELKNLLKESEESPSHDFSAKTMNKIEALETSKASLSIKGNNSSIRFIIPVIFLALLGYSLLQTKSQFTSLDITLPSLDFSWLNFNFSSINIHFSWFMALAVLAFGFWAWIWWEKRNFRFK